MTKQEQKDEAFKIYQEAVALAEKNNQEAEQEDETIKIIEGKKYQLIK